MRIALILMLTLLVGTALAAEEAEHVTLQGSEASGHVEEHGGDLPHPQLSHDTTWAGAMVIVVLGMFVAAAAVGVVVRANMPDEPPMADAHHDDHGHGHDDHGASGHHH